MTKEDFLLEVNHIIDSGHNDIRLSELYGKLIGFNDNELSLLADAVNMYHEEKVINGILCRKSTPDGEWREYSKEYLTEKIMQLRNTIKLQEVTQEDMEDNYEM